MTAASIVLINSDNLSISTRHHGMELLSSVRSTDFNKWRKCCCLYTVHSQAPC